MTERAIKTIKWDFKPITKAGLYSGVSLEIYHQAKICDGPSVSSSGLRKLFSESPAHFYAEWPGNPNREDQDDKPHFVLGRAVHHLMLGEPFFAKLFAVQPDEYPDKVTGEMKKWTYGAAFCKKWRDQQWKDGKAILTTADVANIRGMAERLGANPLVRHGALNGLIERSGFFKDKPTGLWVKIRPDAIPTDSGDYTDLKTTVSVRWNELCRAIFEFGYHQQLALIRTGARELGLPFNSASLIFVEKTSPWCERIVTVKDSDLDRGERANRAALDAMARCIKSGHWPGPGGEREDAEHIEMPEWAQKQIDDRLEYGIAT